MKPDRIGLSVPFLCLLLLFILYEKSGRGTVMLAAALLHEGGHLLAMALLKCRPQKIVFGSFAPLPEWLSSAPWGSPFLFSVCTASALWRKTSSTAGFKEDLS